MKRNLPAFSARLTASNAFTITSPRYHVLRLNGLLIRLPTARLHIIRPFWTQMRKNPLISKQLRIQFNFHRTSGRTTKDLTSSYTELTSNITASQFKRKHQVVVLRYAVSGAIDAGQSETENRFRVAHAVLQQHRLEFQPNAIFLSPDQPCFVTFYFYRKPRSLSKPPVTIVLVISSGRLL
jgi:hypothetical protein